MAHFYHFLNRLLFTVIVTAGILSPAIAQVGFNNPNPDSTSLIDMKATDKGLLIPRMTTVDRTNMTLNGKKPANALLVFDTDLQLFFFYDTVTVPNRWLAMNPWVSQGSTTSDIVTATNGNVGIGTIAAPIAKLEVNGTIKSGNIASTGAISASSASVTGNITSGSINTGNITGTTVTAANFVGNGVIPVGGIIMWSGTTPPTGWALCNGQMVNGIATPDLRGRFVVGYDPTKVDYDNPGNRSTGGTTAGDTGGEEKHTLTIAEMPNHSHSFTDYYSVDQNSAVGNGGTRAIGGTSRGDITTSTGGGQAHENRPPYYTLAYIIRVQ